MHSAGLRELNLSHGCLIPYKELLQQIGTLRKLVVLDMGEAPSARKQDLLSDLRPANPMRNHYLARDITQ